MVNDYDLDSLCSKVRTSVKSLYSYSSLVADLELLPSQCQKINSPELRHEFFIIWNDMELINACALSEWEECGRPSNNLFNRIWDNKYKKDASILIDKLVLFLSKIAK